MARRLDVARVQPNWSGEVLDLVVDFVTYVFVPAYAITASGLLLPVAAPLLGIGVAVSGALYFADKRMKASDNHFRGFPALWNVVALYFFVLRLPQTLNAIILCVLAVMMFAPVVFVHPMRVVRLRTLTLVMTMAWFALAGYAINANFMPETWVRFAFVAVAAYFLALPFTRKTPWAD